MKSVIASFGFVSAALAASRTSAPSGCITVAKSGGDYSTVQDAVDSLSTTSTTAQCIFIGEGTYEEQVIIAARDAQLTIYGYTEDTATYSDNKVTITYDYAVADGLSDEETGTLRNRAAGFRLYNVNVANTYGEGSQAIALSSYADSGFYGCQFTGYQDTVLSEEGYQIFLNSYIEGATDFIFGQEARSWFQNCDLGVLSASLGYLTANGNPDGGDSLYVFHKCTVAAASGESVTSGAYYLGRPWSEYAQVVFQETSLSDVINSAGWSEWSSSEPNTCCVLFAEYDNSGEGSEGTRASFSEKLSSAYTISEVLGSDYASASYFDADYYAEA